MTKLACSVDTCAYNDERMCCLKSIKVDGSKADTERDTCCSSFSRERQGCCNSSMEPNPEMRVACDAVNCVYNEEHVCSAGRINIAGSGANRMEETECASFQAH